MTKQFETLAALERQMGAAHQLRSEILASAIRDAFTRAVRTIRYMLVRVDVRESHET